MREYECIAAAHEHIILVEFLEHNHLKHYQKSMPNVERNLPKLVIDTIFCEDPKYAAIMGHSRDREAVGVDIYAREAPAENVDMAEELRNYIALLHQSGRSPWDSAEKIDFQSASEVCRSDLVSKQHRVARTHSSVFGDAMRLESFGR